jgi:hypothetical protein
MTTINSIASVKTLSALDIMDVAADCILAVGDMMRDLRRANLNPTSEVWGMLTALQTRFIGMKEGDAQPADDKTDAQTFTVAYTPEGKMPTPTTFEKKVDDTPVTNDITQRRNDFLVDITAKRNDFLVELASRKNMSRNGRKVKGTFEPGAKQFIGGDDYATVLDSLVHDGMIEEFKIGRGTFYRLPVKETVKVDPAPTLPEAAASADEVPDAFDNGAPAPVEPTTTTNDSNDDIPASFGDDLSEKVAAANDDVKREFVNALVDIVKADKTAKKTRKSKNAPKSDAPTAPPADTAKPSEDTIGAAFLILGKRVSALDTVKAKKAVKLMAELRGLLS